MLRILTGEQYNTELKTSSTTNINNEELDRTVLNIIEQVREKGDQALINYTAQFDKVELDNLLVSEEEFIEASALVSDDFIVAIKKAHENIKAFHAEQTEKSWFTTRESGILLGQKITPLASVGIYVPGGKATYPSTVLMNAIPAKIAGVKDIAITTPLGKTGK